MSGCNTKSQERLDNEEKVKKLAENMGVSNISVEQRIENMSDEDLANVAKVVNDEGKIDPSKVFAEVQKEQLEENNKLLKDASLKEISLDCSDSETTTHVKEGTIISLNGMGETPDYQEVRMNNLDGEIEIKIYNVKYDSEENSYYKELKKGELIKTISGNINDLMKLEQKSSLLGINYEYTYLLKLNDLDKNKLPLNKNYFDEEYEYNYLRFPIWIDINYKQDGKEYREVLSYENYFGCEVYEKVDQIDPNEPNNEIAYLKKYKTEKVKLSDITIEKGYGPYDMVGYSEKKNILKGKFSNSGSEKLERVELRVYFLDENKTELKTEDYTIITSYSNPLEANSQMNFSFVIEKDQPLNWGYKVNVEVKEISLEE